MNKFNLKQENFSKNCAIINIFQNDMFLYEVASHLDEIAKSFLRLFKKNTLKSKKQRKDGRIENYIFFSMYFYLKKIFE